MGLGRRLMSTPAPLVATGSVVRGGKLPVALGAGFPVSGAGHGDVQIASQRLRRGLVSIHLLHVAQGITSLVRGPLI
jgi:hypothetical protein